MKCFLWKEQKFSIVNRKEEITDNVFLITDYEQENIKKTLESDGHLWLDSSNHIQWSKPKPSEIYVWDDSIKDWIVDEVLRNEALTKLKTNLWEDIKAYRSFKSTDGALVSSINKWVHTDDKSQVLYSRTRDYLEANPEHTIELKMMDNTFVTVNLALLKELCNSVFETGQSVFNVAEKHRLTIMAIDDLDKLKSYDYKANWVTTYSDIK